MEGLEASGRAVQRLLDFDTRIEEASVAADAAMAGLSELATTALEAFRDALDDDLNTADALAALFVLVGLGNAALDRTGPVPPAEREAIKEALASMDRVLGLVEVARASRMA